MFFCGIFLNRFTISQINLAITFFVTLYYFQQIYKKENSSELIEEEKPDIFTFLNFNLFISRS